VVSSFFADIFKNNCLNIGVLPVQVTPEFLAEIFAAIEANPQATFTVDLPMQRISIDSSGSACSFDINGYKKNNMLNGFDDIDFLISQSQQIDAFAAQSPL